MGFSRPQDRRPQPPKRSHHPLKPQSNPLRSALSKTTQTTMASILKLLPQTPRTTLKQQQQQQQPTPSLSRSPSTSPSPSPIEKWLQFTSPPNNPLSLSPSISSPPASSPPTHQVPPSLKTLQATTLSTREALTLHAYDVGVLAALQSMLLYWNSRATAIQTSSAERRIFLREAQRLTELMDDAEREMLISNADLVAKQGVEERLWGRVVEEGGRELREREREGGLGMEVDLGGDGTEEMEFATSSGGDLDYGREVDMDGEVDQDEEMEYSEYEDVECVEGIEIESEESEYDWMD